MSLLVLSPAMAQLNNTAKATSGAQTKDFKFIIKTNPLSALGGPLWVLYIVPLTAEYKVMFEAKTTSRQSIQVGLGYLGTSPFLKSVGNIGQDTSIVSLGFHGQLWYKFFLTSDKAPGGFYIGPHVSYATAKMTVKPATTGYFKASKINVDVVLGYQVITKGGFALDIFTGLGMKSKKYETGNLQTNQTFTDLKLNNKSTINVPFGFSFGYAF
jgi:hypothetical protein